MTPGPWTRDKYGNVIAADGSKVLFRSVSMLCSGDSKDIAEAEANTDLATAAPDLLAALRDLMDLESRGRIMPIGKEWDAARAALSKALGQSGGTR